jgi:hypothetical protein
VEQISREFSDPQYFGVVTAIVSRTLLFSYLWDPFIDPLSLSLSLPPTLSPPSTRTPALQQAILNEPAFYLNDNLLQVGKQFTIDAYYNARYPWASQGSGSSSGLLVVYHDGFQPSESIRVGLREVYRQS